MPLQNGNSIKNFQNLPPQGPYFSAAKIAKHHRLQRQTAFVEYAFQVTLCRASSLPAGKFCGAFRAKFTGGQVNGNQHGQLFHGQKTDKSRTETLKNVPHRWRLTRKKDRRSPCIWGNSAGLFCQYREKYYTPHRKVQQKASAFLPRFQTRKDPVFSDRVLVVAGTGLEPATSGL